MRIHAARKMFLFGALAALSVNPSSAHEPTKAAFLAALQAEEESSAARSPDKNRKRCQLTIDLVDAESGRSLPGMVRLTILPEGERWPPDELIKRRNDWYTMPARATVAVPQAKLRIEAVHGLGTETAQRTVDLTGKQKAEVKLPLKQFYDAAAKGWRSGNTHLHLMKLTRAEADRYLRTVPKADGLDLVFLSHLERVPDDETYISNSYSAGDLKKLSEAGIPFGNGEEHRHNFEAYGEGYGHVMLLNIKKLIQPVSIGPGIMKKGTDGIPLRRGIKQARRQGATAIWCHNNSGLEDIPNWMAGMLDAQNIFDGGPGTPYDSTFYRYLNLGLKVPFSTGTDWFIFDFLRAYVPIDAPFSSKDWLRTLASGRSYITNGTFLELRVGDSDVGDTIELEESSSLMVRGRAAGRNDFRKIELIHNGKVVHATGSKPVAGHFEAEMDFTLVVDRPGWVALRIPWENNENELGHPLRAHTSPVYIELAGKRIFEPEVARELIAEMEEGIKTIEAKATFANDQERRAVLNVHQEGIAILRRRLEEHK